MLLNNVIGDQIASKKCDEWQEVEPDSDLDNSHGLVDDPHDHVANVSVSEVDFGEFERLFVLVRQAVILGQSVVVLVRINRSRALNSVQVFEHGVGQDVLQRVLTQGTVEERVEVCNDGKRHEVHDDGQEVFALHDHQEIDALDNEDAEGLQEAGEPSDKHVVKSVLMVQCELHVVQT